MWQQVLVWVVTSLISYALQPKPSTPKAAGLEDISAPTAEEGGEIPVLFGTRDISGPNVVWYGDLYVNPVKKKGGKK